MQHTDKAEFVQLLNLCYATLLKPLPPVEGLQLWLTVLEPYSIEQVRAALSQHMRESKFPPVPADVVTRMPKQSDDRPDANEAWAIALRGRDERDTVVWTQECAEAFSIAASVLDDDETGARMAFKAAYERLVERARADGRPVQWIASLGHDAAQREVVVIEAVRVGRLQLEHAKAFVPALSAPDSAYDPNIAQQNLARMREITAAASKPGEQL
ncbi:hypothetical protein [Paraburkholderia sediminicola]|uniref:hypothetical protein n=1 Tax=Paraburkholderia sediminicola TaxID=458836 RepID=UPI0038B9209F